MRSIIIIGAGMGGLATGIYGQRNGFDTRAAATAVEPLLRRLERAPALGHLSEVPLP